MGPPASGRVPRALPYSGCRAGGASRGYGALTLCGRAFQPARPPLRHSLVPGPTTPGDMSPGLGWCAFARRYLRNHSCFPLLRVLRCFTSPRLAPAGLCVRPGVTRHEARGVAPFGNPRIKACLPLPVAYRSLPRPSSPRDAKASVVRPYALGRAARPPAGARRGDRAPRCNSSLPSIQFSKT